MSKNVVALFIAFGHLEGKQLPQKDQYIDTSRLGIFQSTRQAFEPAWPRSREKVPLVASTRRQKLEMLFICIQGCFIAVRTFVATVHLASLSFQYFMWKSSIYLRMLFFWCSLSM